MAMDAEWSEEISRARVSGLYRQIVLHWYSTMGKRNRGTHSLRRQISQKLNAPRTWRKRRALYGETGRRPVDRRLRWRLEGGEVAGWKNNPQPNGEQKS